MIRGAVLFAAVAIHVSAGTDQDLTISGNVNGAVVTVRTSARTAGAIKSIRWRGKEFINAFDHGRELQSAISFDGYGECLNPTEAGSSRDGPGNVSSSRMLDGAAHGNRLDTTTEMAYWLVPEAVYHTACGPHADFRQARNQTVRSQDKVAKRVEILRDVIQYDVTFTTADDHESATFEALTGYMPPDFADFYGYDSRTRTMVPIGSGPGEQSLPVVLTTPDHRFAMGVFSASLPQAAHPKAGYGRFRFLNNPQIANWNTVKWNAVFREKPVPRGEYHYRCYVAIGTLDDVRRAMDRLSQEPH